MFQVNQKTRPDYMQITDNLYGDGIYNDEIPKQVQPSKDHKTEIISTRKGGFGSSDASMIIDIATKSKIYKTEHLKRIAVFEGLIEPDNFTNKYMEVGNQREKEIFDWFCKNNSWYEHQYNPCLVYEDSVEKYGFKLFTHIDIIAEHSNRYEIIEVKTSQESTANLIEKYDAQLKWHLMIAEQNYDLDNKYNLDNKITLFHYSENFNDEPFNVDKINITKIEFSKKEISDFEEKISVGLAIIKEFLEVQRSNNYAALRKVCKEKKYIKTTKNELSENLEKQMVAFKNNLQIIKKIQDKADAMKEKMFKIMTENCNYINSNSNISRDYNDSTCVHSSTY